jgi:copper transport protein
VVWGAGVGVVGLVAAIPAEAALVDGGTPSWSSITDSLTGSVGLQALVGAAGLALLVVATTVAAVRVQPIVARILVVDGTLGALVGFVIVGHTRTAAPVALTTVVDVVHLGAAAVWTGGLVALLLTLRGREVPAVASLVARFSAIATVTIVLVAAAGSVLGWRIVGSWGALTGSTYGVLLIVKVGLFVVLAGIGAFNKFRLVDRVGGDEPEVATSRLRTTLVAEILVVVAIVGVTASFTSISPERATPTPETTLLTCAEVQAMENLPGMENMNHECTGTTTSSIVPFDPTQGSPTTIGGSTDPGGGVAAVADSAAFGDGLALVSVAPAKVGTNTITISLTDADGVSIDPKDPPTVELRLREKSIGPISATAERVGPGAYRVQQDLVLAGEWEINVSAVVSDFEQPQAIVRINVAP